jgi:AcrR family transcriptional regulator
VIGPTVDVPRRRADAERNRLAILAAAADVFATGGLDVGIDEVAARAGVGKATVYRCFATKDDLIAAVVRERLRTWTTLAAEALEAPAPGAALRALVRTMAVRLAADRMFAIALTNDAVATIAAERAAATAAIDRLVEHARAVGDLRPDVCGYDLRVLFGGAARALVAAGERDPTVWTRFADLVCDALGDTGADR